MTVNLTEAMHEAWCLDACTPASNAKVGRSLRPRSTQYKAATGAGEMRRSDTKRSSYKTEEMQLSGVKALNGKRSLRYKRADKIKTSAGGSKASGDKDLRESRRRAINKRLRARGEDPVIQRLDGSVQDNTYNLKRVGVFDYDK